LVSAVDFGELNCWRLLFVLLPSSLLSPISDGRTPYSTQKICPQPVAAGSPCGAGAGRGSLFLPAPRPADDSAGAATATTGNVTYARAELLRLAPTLTQLADRADLRDDASIREQRDNFTSATARLEDGDPAASLRPGLVAAANLLLAVQQKAYPNLETEANALTLQASELSGRDATPAEQSQNREYLSQVSTLLNTMSYPAKDVL
jgi:hypothetical protein